MFFLFVSSQCSYFLRYHWTGLPSACEPRGTGSPSHCVSCFAWSGFYPPAFPALTAHSPVQCLFEDTGSSLPLHSRSISKLSRVRCIPTPFCFEFRALDLEAFSPSQCVLKTFEQDFTFIHSWPPSLLSAHLYSERVQRKQLLFVSFQSW